MEREITRAQPLLNAQGLIVEDGWARKPLWEYDRSKVKGGMLRIKEWEYWAIINQSQGYALTATMSDLGYAAFFALSYIDLERREYAQADAITPLSWGKLGLAPSSAETSQVSWANKKLRLAFFNKGDSHHLMVGCPTLVLPDGTVGLDYAITLTRPASSESLNIATSWEQKRTAFYLNEKANSYAVSGTVRRGMEEERLLLGEAWGVLDWGRGRWTYKNTWYWASLSTVVNNTPLGLNFGYGFSDRSIASENAILYNYQIHKIGEVRFDFDPEDLMKEWKIHDTEGRVDLVFEPWVDRKSKTNALLIKSVQDQCFGAFSGTVILDDGTPVQIDEAVGFAEKVFNRW